MKTDDELFVEICELASRDFIDSPQKIFDLVGEMREPSIYGDRFTLSILYDYTKRGLMKKEEFVKGVNAICTGKVEKSLDKSRKEKKSKMRELKKMQKTTGTIKVICDLDGETYHRNKNMFHKLADKFDMEKKGGWNKELNAAILHWNMKDSSESVSGFFVRRGDVTTRATLTWRGTEKTQLATEFVQICKDLNGKIDDKELQHRAGQSKLFQF